MSVPIMMMVTVLRLLLTLSSDYTPTGSLGMEDKELESSAGASSHLGH